MKGNLRGDAICLTLENIRYIKMYWLREDNAIMVTSGLIFIEMFMHRTFFF